MNLLAVAARPRRRHHRPAARPLPYSRTLHEQTERALRLLQEGQPIEGTTEPGSQAGNHSAQVQLFEGPRPILPPKTG